MKHLLQISAALLMSFVIFSCKSNSTSSTNTDNNSTVASGTMTATMNGKPWSAQAGGYRHAPPDNNLQFEGFVGFEQIAIVVAPTINGPGTYLFDAYPFNGNTAYPHYSNSKETYSQVISGSLTITTLTSTNVQGTFNFKMRSSGLGDTVTVTDGKFNAPLL